ncbi:MAG: PEP-CTERM sorting domain-containing protein [Phycisphaerae bacterium]
MNRPTIKLLAGKGCVLAALVLAGLAIGVVPASADDHFYVTSSDTSTNVWGALYDPGATRTAYVHVSGSGTLLTVDSGWDNGYSGSKSYWQMADGSDILVTGDAWINNNMSDLVNARVFQAYGTNNGEVIEFAEGFNADLGSQSSPQGGLSTLVVYDCTMITHHTQNLPSIWKYIPDGGGTALSHHGLLTFTSGPNGKWQVRTNSQEYEGGTYWKYDWELDVAAGLSLTYVDTWVERHETGNGADIGFGPYVGYTNTTFNKTGDGTLNLNGEMGWQQDSTMAVQDGIVNFNHYDPGYEWTYGYMNQSGQYLSIDISSGAAVNFNNPIDEPGAEHVTRVWGVENIDNQGSFSQNGGQLDISGGYTAYAGSTTGVELWSADVSSSKITAGSVTVAGELALSIGDDYTPSFGDVFTVFDAGTLAGQFATVAGVSIDGGDKALAVTYDTSSDLVQAEVALPGDVNLDDTVGGGDLGLLLGNWGMSSAAVWSDADLSGDGRVTGGDLGLLLDNWGRATAAAAVVPEPATLAMLGIGSLAVLLKRKRS